MNARKKYTLLFLVMFLGIGLDQVTKFIAKDHFVKRVYSEAEAAQFNLISSHKVQPGMSNDAYESPDILVLDHLFYFTYAENDGAFLSLGSTWNPVVRLIFLTILPGLLLVVVMIFMLSSKRVGSTEAWAFSLIAAGGVGNIIDRVFVGWVVDFMHMDFWGITQTGVFNVADIYIMVGIGIYIVAYLRQRKTPVAPAPDAPVSGNSPQSEIE